MLAALLPFLFVASTTPAVLTVPTHQLTYVNQSTTSIRAYIESQATTTPKRALYIAENESHFDPHARGDMHIICKNKDSPYYGEPVVARGTWQITLCNFWWVTDEQADDIVWATAWALPKIADPETCKMLWTTCREYFRGSHVIE